MENDELRAKFLERYGESEEAIHHYFAPGRVNLIGEHIDYNGGHVLPAAIGMGVHMMLRADDSSQLRIASTLDDIEHRFSVEEALALEASGQWYDYVLGVLQELHRRGVPVSGADILLDSDLPIGAGLSSSAAVEVVTAYAVMRMANHPVDRRELAILCQLVENRHVGVNCGIMDQYAVANGKAGHAMLLDCDAIESEYIPVDLGDYQLLILHTNKPRKLVESKYNERRAECDQALAILGAQREISYLCEAEFEELELVSDPVIKRRLRHVITEEWRVLLSVEALKSGEIEQFGQLLTASHSSLRDDYEVSGDELDALVDLSLDWKGCIGARMTGAGFGGCAIALIHRDSVEGFAEYLKEGYEARTGLMAGVYETVISDGVVLVDG